MTRKVTKTEKVLIKNIKYYCYKCNLSYEELSIMLGKDKDFIEKIENYEFRDQLTTTLLDNLSNIFKVDVISLLKEHENKS